MQRGLYDVQATIKVFGIGGAGCNAVDRMVSSQVSGVDFVTINTDAQALSRAIAPQKLQIGFENTRGLGAGGDLEIGRDSAMRAEREIKELAEGVDMAFVTCGMGGGTGTGAAAVVAELCKASGALTVGVVTKPFTFEGPRRSRTADTGIGDLAQAVDTLIVVPNDRLLDIVQKTTTLAEAFAYADDVLRQAVQSISDIVLVPGVINVDFADVRSIMEDAGPALMGIGHGRGENKAMEAAARAVSSPLLERRIDGAARLLVNLTGGPDLTIGEANDAMSYIQEFVDAETGNIIMGHVVDDGMRGQARIIVLAAGLPGAQPRREEFRFPSADEIAQPAVTQSATAPDTSAQAPPIKEDTLDIPSFLRRRNH